MICDTLHGFLEIEEFIYRLSQLTFTAESFSDSSAKTKQQLCIIITFCSSGGKKDQRLLILLVVTEFA